MLVLLPYEFLLEQNFLIIFVLFQIVLLPYEFLLEQNGYSIQAQTEEVLLPYEFLLEQNWKYSDIHLNWSFVTI